MNVFRYQFSQENKNYLLDFLKTADQHRSRTSKFCNLSEYKRLNKFLFIDENLQQELKDHIAKQNIIIDITEDDEIENVTEFVEAETSSFKEIDFDVPVIKLNLSTDHDITQSIKEHLEAKKCIPDSILNSLNENEVNENIFCLLAQELNFEEILNFGVSLQNANVINDYVVSYYIRYLLIKQLTLEYSDQLQDILNEFSIKYTNILVEELTKILLGTENESKIFLQFIDSLNVDFKTKLVRKFIFSCENFHEKYVSIVEILLTAQVEYDTLNKLIEIFSHSTSNFSNDKSFGKLLVKVITLLGKNVAPLEHPLKHIIGSHKSIWKSKIQKAFDDCLQDSFILSQSFR